jgi:hypothetical protein
MRKIIISFIIGALVSAVIFASLGRLDLDKYRRLADQSIASARQARRDLAEASRYARLNAEGFKRVTELLRRTEETLGRIRAEQLTIIDDNNSARIENSRIRDIIIELQKRSRKGDIQESP